MKPTKSLFILASIICSVSLFAQVGVDFNNRIEDAKMLYRSGTYYAAEQSFSKLLEESQSNTSLNHIELEAYRLMCAINLDRDNAVGLVKRFSEQYPNSIELPLVRYTLASHLFDKGEYGEALEIFTTINSKLLHNDKIDCDFKYAFCNMDAGNYSQAESLFLQIIAAGDTPRYYSSIYYLGYVYYRDSQFEKAFDYFSKAQADSKFALMASYFATESKFMLKDFDYVVENGPKIYNSLESDLQSTLSRMISEAYYEKQMTEEALRYFKLYASNANLSRVDHYFGGILSYNTGNYEEAKDFFMNVVGEDDAIGQNAEYYAANALLKEYNKVSAMNLFKSASEKSYDEVIKEDAFFNFAKLSFDVNSDISQFESFIQQYPGSGKDDVINGYMAASFLLKKDYTSAIELLQKIKNLSVDNANNLQKASFFRALQLIESGSYRSAIPMLETSLNYGRNVELKNLAGFWQAECFYRNNRYSDAIDILRALEKSASFKVSSEYPMAVYNLAYCYFKAEKFADAENWFSKYLSGKGLKYSTDANIRLADSYFMQSKYNEAAKLYERMYNANRSSDVVYSAYQAAVSYGLSNNESKKIDMLRQVTRNNLDSPLYCQALYELGRTYVQKGDDDKASDCFYTLIGRKSDSLFFSKALIELAMINANEKRYDQAIDFYKQLIEQAPYSEEVQDAISGLESIYLIQNRPDEFLTFLDDQQLSNVKSEDEKEKMLFTSAEHLYLSRNYSKAITSLQNFLKRYPEGPSSLQANYYLAESLKALNRKESAADEYLKVIKMGQSDFLCSALKNYADINYEIGNYELAGQVYNNLISAAGTGVMEIEGYAGLMRSYFYNRQYKEAIETTQKLGQINGLTKELQREAEFILAKSYMTIGERDMALAVFEDMSKDCSDEYGAESAYIMIQNAYSTGDFAAVETMIYDFVDKDTQFVYWLAKSFIVLGDTYMDRGDLEQAKATYQSIIEGYEPVDGKDDVISQVEDRLKKMEE